jgi:hypothetical protein
MPRITSASAKGGKSFPASPWPFGRLPGSFWIEDIANPPDGPNDSGFCGVVFQLAADPRDADINGTVEGFFPMGMRQIKQLFPRQYTAWPRGKGGQQIIFARM